jgi:hypothetical protein
LQDYCGKTYDYISDYTIPGYPLRRASQTVQKLFEVTLLYLYCRREKTIKGGNFLSFLSHVHLRPFSFILNPKAVKCLHTFEIQNTANVVAMEEVKKYM